MPSPFLGMNPYLEQDITAAYRDGSRSGKPEQTGG